MVRTGRRLRQWLFWAVSIAMLIVPLTLGAQLWGEIYEAPLLRELNGAERRWENRSFARYRLTIERQQIRRRCLQRVDVDDEQIVRVLINNCYSGAMTVSDLFDMLRQNLTPLDCMDDACKCRLTYRVTALYDEGLGYPVVAVLIPSSPRTEPVDAEFWGQAPGMNRQLGCPPGGPGLYETIAVRELAPLP